MISKSLKKKKSKKNSDKLAEFISKSKEYDMEYYVLYIMEKCKDNNLLFLSKKGLNTILILLYFNYYNKTKAFLFDNVIMAIDGHYRFKSVHKFLNGLYSGRKLKDLKEKDIVNINEVFKIKKHVLKEYRKKFFIQKEVQKILDGLINTLLIAREDDLEAYTIGVDFFLCFMNRFLSAEKKIRNEDIRKIVTGKLKEVADDEAAQDKDVTNINFEGFIDGEAFEGGKAEGFDLTLGSHSFIDNFEDQIVGHKKGDEFDVTVMFPENYGAENLAGKPAIFKVKVNSIKRKEEAELNDDLAKELGYDSLEDLKVKTRESLTKREETRINNEFKGKVVEAVVANTNVEVPAELTNREVEYQINRFAQQLQMQGISLEQYFQMTGQTLDKMREESREMAEKSVKTELVLSEITKAENIEVSDDEVNAEIDKMATMYGMDKEALLADVRKSGNYARFIDETKYRLSHEKTIDLLVNSAKVK